MAQAIPITNKQLYPWEIDMWKCLLYSNSGAGKTQFLAEIIKQPGMHPAKVFMFDVIGNDKPYRDIGVPTPYERLPDGGMFCYVNDSAGKLLVEIEYFFDLRPTLLETSKYPCALERFQSALLSHVDEEWKGYKFAIIDSYKSYFDCALNAQQYKLNPRSKSGATQDGKQWYGGARLSTISDILCTFAWSPLHVCMTAHVDRERAIEQDKQLWGVDAPGSMSVDLPRQFPEVYYMNVTDGGERTLTVNNDGQYMCKSHIVKATRIPATWEAIWRKGA